MEPVKTILHITPFFSPNIGGVETHLDDLTSKLKALNYRQIVLTYSPLSTTTPYQRIESTPLLTVRRFYLPGNNLFHKLEKLPILNLLYITPTLLLRSILWILNHRPHIDTVHSHGLNGALIGICIQKIFGIRNHITSIYSTYDNVPLNSLATKLLVVTLNHTQAVLTQSNQSVDQLKRMGVTPTILHRYYHWIDLKRFTPFPQKPKTLSVLFVGRMIPSKNAITLAQIAKHFPNISFDFIGTGPQYQLIAKLKSKYKNIHLLGDVPYSQLHNYYQQASVLCLPSIYQEGWGRVLAESVACGTPVICSNLGGTVEAVSSEVAIIVKPTSTNFRLAIKSFFENKLICTTLTKNCRPYALKHYSPKNVNYITRYY